MVEAEAVEKADDEDLLLLLLAPQTIALSAIVGSEVDKSPPSTAALVVLLEAPEARRFLHILTCFDGIMIKCLGSGKARELQLDRTSAGQERRQTLNVLEQHRSARCSDWLSASHRCELRCSQ